MTSSNRRQRQLARAKFERQQARRAEREDKARVRQRVVAIVVVGALVIAGGGWAIFTLIDRGNEPESTASEIDEVAEELGLESRRRVYTVADRAVARLRRWLERK